MRNVGKGFYHSPIRLMKVIFCISLGLILIYIMSNETKDKPTHQTNSPLTNSPTQPAQLDLYLSRRMSEIKKSCGDICQTDDNEFVKGKMICNIYI